MLRQRWLRFPLLKFSAVIQLALQTALPCSQLFSTSTAALCKSNMAEPNSFSVSYVTMPDAERAKTLAEKLVKEKLAACVNIIPGITSVYEWKEEIQTDSEVLMLIKSRVSRLEELTKFVRENHPYDVCEVISTPILHGNPPYLKWLGDIVQDKTK